MTLGVGAGQMSRVDSARIAAIKAQNAGVGSTRTGSAVASDAFFPFRDGSGGGRGRRDLRDSAGRLDARSTK